MSCRKTLSRCMAVGLVAASLIAIAPANPAGASTTWEDGDVVAAVLGSPAKHRIYNSNGAFKEQIDSRFNGDAAGCAFNPGGDKLYTTNFPNTKVVVHNSAAPHQIAQVIDTALASPGGHSESVVFSRNGHFYVGNADGNALIHEYDAAGLLIDTDDVAIERRGSDHIDLASDQSTMYYTSEGRRVMRFDVASDRQLPDFAALPGSGFALGLRLLPPGDGSGGLLVADAYDIKRLDAGGDVIQRYDTPGENLWFSLALATGAASFWAAGLEGRIYRFNLASGAIELGPIDAPPQVGGLCVKGEPRAAVSSAITLSPSSAKSPVGERHFVDAQVTDPTTGRALAGALVRFSVRAGPNAGVSGRCSHALIGGLVGSSSCRTDLGGNVRWSYRGTRGVGHDVIEAAVTVPSSTFPGTQRVTATAGSDWLVPARYVVLGDSYSSGEGLDPYGFPAPGEEKPNRCHRSETQAHAQHFQPRFYSESIFAYSTTNRVKTTFDFVACAGATTRNVRSDGVAQNNKKKGYTEPAPQLGQDVVDLDTNVVTIIIGGNDAGFSTILEGCGRKACTASDYKLKDGKPLTEWLPAKIDKLGPRLRTTFEQIREAVGADDTAIFVLGYPQLFPATHEEQTCSKLRPWHHEQDFLRSMDTRMNDVLAQAAVEAGVHFVPVEEAFAGHEPCGNKDEWINALTLAGLTVGDSSFHPNARGQIGYADALAAWIEGELEFGGEMLGNGLPANPEPRSISPFGAQSVQAAAATDGEGADGLGTIGALLLDPVPGSPGPCAGDLRIFSPGQKLSAGGSEFAAGAEVSITLGVGDSNVMTEVASVTADENGVIDVVVTLPAHLPLGSLAELRATGDDMEDGSRLLLRVFSIEAPVEDCDDDDDDAECEEALPSGDSCDESEDDDESLDVSARATSFFGSWMRKARPWL